MSGLKRKIKTTQLVHLFDLAFDADNPRVADESISREELIVSAFNQPKTHTRLLCSTSQINFSFIVPAIHSARWFVVLGKIVACFHLIQKYKLIPE